MPPLKDPFYRMSFRLFTAEQKAMKQRFRSAKSASEVLEAFKDLKKCFKESDLGLACGYVVEKLQNEENEDSEKILTFGKQALGILLRDDSCMPIVSVLQILANSCFKLNRLEESVKYLTWATRLLEKVEGIIPNLWESVMPIVSVLRMVANSCSKLNRLEESSKYLTSAVRLLEKVEGIEPNPKESVLPTIHAIHLELLHLKQSMGTKEGCISYRLKNLGITEKLWGRNSRELAGENWGVFLHYFTERKYRESQPFCLKALEIYLTCPGDNSDKVAECSQLLGLVHNLIGEHETALHHNLLSQKLSKKLGCTSLSLRREIDGANVLYELGRVEEAIQALKDIVPRTEKDSENRTIALTYMAHAFIKQKMFSDAKECAEIVCGILEKEKDSSLADGVGFTSIAEVYKKIGECETALSLLRKGLVIVQGNKKTPVYMLKPLLEVCSKSLVPLLLSTRNFEEAIQLLEDQVNTAKKSSDSRHLQVGEAYRRLGSAYFQTNNLEMAAQAFAYAKDIFDECLGLQHDASIMMCLSVFTTHRVMGSYSIAITCLEEIIKRLEILGGPNAQNDLAEAAIAMAELKEMTDSSKASQSGNSSQRKKAINKWNENVVIEGDSKGRASVEDEVQLEKALKPIEALKTSKDRIIP